MLRTHKISDVNESLEGEKVTLTGWVDTIREHGKVVFVDLRDRYGKIQTVIPKKHEQWEDANKLTQESCISVTGEVKKRPEGTENGEILTGKVELPVDELNIFSIADEIPFDPKERNVKEDTRLKYRYLDLRNPKLQKNIELRHKLIEFMREYLDEKDFLEITTPLLTKSTPEGARDFIVPSRLHEGKFYALPQSPQQYKQLLMISGVDKYFQIAPCLRDEDARADRSPGEFHQLDMEMSFVERDDVLEIIENLMKKMVEKILPNKKLTFKEFPKLTYDEVMKKYGTDKPDLRENKEDPNELAFAYIVDFPLFEEEKSPEGYYAPMHHMFTMPKDEDLDKLNEKDAHKVKAKQYDLVLNGAEVGGGSIRIHDPEIQSKIFELIGFDEKQKQEFKHMLTAFKYGVPPHGGLASGIDRLISVLLGENNLREVTAFPKNRYAKDLVMGAPSDVTEQQLKDAHIKLREDAVKKSKKKDNSGNEGDEESSEEEEEDSGN